MMMNLFRLCGQSFGISRAQTEPSGGLGAPPPKDGGPVLPFWQTPAGSTASSGRK